MNRWMCDCAMDVWLFQNDGWMDGWMVELDGEMDVWSIGSMV